MKRVGLRAFLSVFAAVCVLGATATAQEASTGVSLPYTCDFESASDTADWVFVNSTESPNHWWYGNGAADNDTYCLYVSDDGVANEYDENAQAYSSVYLPVNCTQAGEYVLSFRYVCEGEGSSWGSNYDYMRVGLLETPPAADYTVTSEHEYAEDTYWSDVSLSFQVTEPGIRYLIFFWRNDGSGGGSGAAIDDISFRINDCPAPTNLIAEALSYDQVRFSWTFLGDDTGIEFRAQYRDASDYDGWTDIALANVSDTSVVVSGLSQNTRYYFRVMSYRNEESYSNWTDGNCSVQTPYSCPAPENVRTQPDGENYLVSWETDAAVSLLYYKKRTEAVWACEQISDDSYLLEGLEKGSIYQVRLRSLCGAGDTSILYSEEVEVVTPCDMVTVPYVESFDESSWIDDNHLLCWTIIDANDDGCSFMLNNDGIDGSACARYRYSGSNAANDYLVSPQIDLTGKDNAAVFFYVKAHSASYAEKYSVLLSTTTADTAAFTTVLLPETEITNTEWELKSFDLADYADQQIYVAIKVSSIPNQYYLYVDNFLVTTCPAPSDIVMSGMTDQSASLTFRSNASNNVFEYRMAGQDPEAEWVVMENQTSPVSLTGLQASTTYEYRMKAVCGPGEESIYTPVASFTTPCAPQPFPYYCLMDDYEYGGIPDCWTIEYEVGYNATWEIDYNYAGYYLVYEGSNQQRSYISTPIIDVSSAIKERLELEFTYAGPYTSGGSSVPAALFVSTDNGMTYDSIEGYPLTETSTTTLHIPLADLVGDAATVRFMLRGYGNSSYYSGFKVYSFNVVQAPICFPPTNITIEELAHNRALLSWVAPESGSSQYYTVIYGSGSDYDTLQTDGLENQFELPDLTQNTSYTVHISTMCETEGSADTVLVFTTPYSCPAPANLELASVLATSVGLAWEGNGGPVEVDYQESSAFEWIHYDTVDANEVLIEGLEPATAYNFRVRVLCADDDRSLYAQLAASTLCETVQLPYSEDFESIDEQTELPHCWSYQWLSNATTPQHWTVNGTRYHEGVSSLRFNSNYLGAGSTSLAVSPALEFEAGKVYFLEFWAYKNPVCNSSTNYQTEGFKVFVGPGTTDTTNAEFIAYIRNNIQLDPVLPGGGWIYCRYILSGLEGENHLLFYGISDYGFDFFIDDISVSEAYDMDLALTEALSYPMAAPGEIPVSVQIENQGVAPYIGDVKISYSVDSSEAVEETLTFTMDEPLDAMGSYTYVFATKAQLDASGEHQVSFAIDTTGDPNKDNNNLAITIDTYDPATLPYATSFDGESEQEDYAVTVDGNQNGESWVYNQLYKDLRVFSSTESVLNDDYYTPAIAMQAGSVDYSFAYGVLDEGKVGKLDMALVSAYGDTAIYLDLQLDSIVDEEAEVHGSIMIEEEGNYMLRFHAYSDMAQSGLFIKDLSLGQASVLKRLYAEICSNETYPFGGRELNQSGVYYDTIEAAAAEAPVPDTLLVLTLKVNTAYEFNIEETICAGDTLRIGNGIYTEAGEYTETMQTVTGCDSIYHISLSIREPYLFELDTAICEGASIEFGGVTYTEAGEYTETHESVDGCDSIYHLVLAINFLPEAPVIEQIDPDTQEIPPYLVATTEEDSVRWYLDEVWIENAKGKEYTPVENGTYYATAVNACGESGASNEIEVTYIVGVEGETIAEAPAVYPNPATENLYVRAQQEILLVQMYSQSGKLVMEAEGSKLPEMSLPVSRLATGTYILKVQTTAGWFTYKVVKQ